MGQSYSFDSLIDYQKLTPLLSMDCNSTCPTFVVCMVLFFVCGDPFSDCWINPLPHGHIYSSRIPLRLIPQVEGQNTRPLTSWCFFDRTSYKPSSSRQKKKIAHFVSSM